MYKIFQIVTARNTCFRVGGPLDTAENSPVVTGILSTFGEPGSTTQYNVMFSNGQYVAVLDVVELWEMKMSVEEEKEALDDFGKLPF